MGITGDGYVPVIEDPISDHADILLGVGRSVIDLPSVLLDTGPACEEPQRQAAEQLRREFGYEAGELIPMEMSAPSGALLAPMLKIAKWRERIGFVPGVYEVPLWRVPEWLWQRRVAGAIEAPGLRRALSVAQECFPRWVRPRVCRAIGEIEAHASVSRRHPRPTRQMDGADPGPSRRIFLAVGAARGHSGSATIGSRGPGVVEKPSCSMPWLPFL